MDAIKLHAVQFHNGCGDHDEATVWISRFSHRLIAVLEAAKHLKLTLYEEGDTEVFSVYQIRMSEVTLTHGVVHTDGWDHECPGEPGGAFVGAGLPEEITEEEYAILKDRWTADNPTEGKDA